MFKTTMRMTIAAIGATCGLGVGVAMAQQSSGDSTQSGLVIPPPQQPPKVITPAPTRGTVGTWSKAPRPIRSLGGVRMPNWHPRSTSIGPNPPPTTPNWQSPGVISPGPAPSPVPSPTPAPIDDNTRRELIRRWILANQGDTTHFNTWPQQTVPVVTDGGVVTGYVPWSPSILHSGGGWAIPVRDTSTGLVRGTYNSDMWRLSFAIGNRYPTLSYRHSSSLFKYPNRMYRSRYSPWSDAWRYQQYGYSPYDSYLVVGNGGGYVLDPQLLGAAAMPPAPERELTDLEKAEVALKGGQGERAADELIKYLKDNPSDFAVRRMLALAMLDQRKMEQAVAVMAEAYAQQPQLARDPIDPEVMSGGEMAQRNRFSVAMDYANRTRTGSSYLLAAVLAQSEDRNDVALKLVEKGVAAGLEAKVADELKMATASR